VQKMKASQYIHKKYEECSQNLRGLWPPQVSYYPHQFGRKFASKLLVSGCSLIRHVSAPELISY
jgi:hypothetical protein